MHSPPHSSFSLSTEVAVSPPPPALFSARCRKHRLGILGAWGPKPGAGMGMSQASSGCAQVTTGIERSAALVHVPQGRGRTWQHKILLGSHIGETSSAPSGRLSQPACGSHLIPCSSNRGCLSLLPRRASLLLHVFTRLTAEHLQKYLSLCISVISPQKHGVVLFCQTVTLVMSSLFPETAGKYGALTSSSGSST